MVLKYETISPFMRHFYNEKASYKIRKLEGDGLKLLRPSIVRISAETGLCFERI